MSQDHYAVLGVAPDSDKRQIRAAYLELIRRYHPDASLSPEAEEKARAVNLAYVVLRDGDKRAQYDRLRGYRLPSQLLYHPEQVSELPVKRRSEAVLFGLVVGAAALSLWHYSSQLERAIPKPAASMSVSESQFEALDTPDLSATGEESLDDLEPALLRSEDDISRPVEVVAFAPTLPVDVSQGLEQPTPASTASQKDRQAKVAAKELSAVRSLQVPAIHEGRQVRAERSCDDILSKAKARSCRMEMFAEKDRRLGALLAEAIDTTDAAGRTKLFESRHRFLDRLTSCATDNCVREAYIARSREVASIAFAPERGQGN